MDKAEGDDLGSTTLQFRFNLRRGDLERIGKETGWTSGKDGGRSSVNYLSGKFITSERVKGRLKTQPPKRFAVPALAVLKGFDCGVYDDGTTRGGGCGSESDIAQQCFKASVVSKQMICVYRAPSRRVPLGSLPYLRFPTSRVPGVMKNLYLRIDTAPGSQANKQAGREIFFKRCIVTPRMYQPGFAVYIESRAK